MDNDVWWAGCNPVPDIVLPIQDKYWEGYLLPDGMRVDCVPFDYHELTEAVAKKGADICLGCVDPDDGQRLLRYRKKGPVLSMSKEMFLHAVKMGTLVFVASKHQQPL